MPTDNQQIQELMQVVELPKDFYAGNFHETAEQHLQTIQSVLNDCYHAINVASLGGSFSVYLPYSYTSLKSADAQTKVLKILENRGFVIIKKDVRDDEPVTRIAW